MRRSTFGSQKGHHDIEYGILVHALCWEEMIEEIYGWFGLGKEVG